MFAIGGDDDDDDDDDEDDDADDADDDEGGAGNGGVHESGDDDRQVGEGDGGGGAAGGNAGGDGHGHGGDDPAAEPQAPSQPKDPEAARQARSQQVSAAMHVLMEVATENNNRPLAMALRKEHNKSRKRGAVELLSPVAVKVKAMAEEEREAALERTRQLREEKLKAESDAFEKKRLAANAAKMAAEARKDAAIECLAVRKETQMLAATRFGNLVCWGSWVLHPPSPTYVRVSSGHRTHHA